MKKTFCVLIMCMIFSFCCVLCAEAATVRPRETDPDSYDLANGSFCAGVENPGTIPEGHFTLTLALEDRYSTEEIARITNCPVIGNIPHVEVAGESPEPWIVSVKEEIGHGE